MHVLSLPPRLRLTRAARARAGELDDSELVPKRSARLAAMSRHREQKPEAQARKVMMKHLGLEVEIELPDEASFEEFYIAFKLPLSASTREAHTCPLSGQEPAGLDARFCLADLVAKHFFYVIFSKCIQ